MDPGYFWLGWIWIIPFFMPIVLLIVSLIVVHFMFDRGQFRPPWRHPDERWRADKEDSESAIEILKKRYAKGEITKDEFEQIKKDIQ